MLVDVHDKTLSRKSSMGDLLLRRDAAKKQHEGGLLTTFGHYCHWCENNQSDAGDGNRFFLTMTCDGKFVSKRKKKPIVLINNIKQVKTLYNDHGCPLCCLCLACNERVTDNMPMIGEGNLDERARMGDDGGSYDDYGYDDMDGVDYHHHQQQQQQQQPQQQQQQQQQEQTEQGKYEDLVRKLAAVEESSACGNTRTRVPAVFAASTTTDGVVTATPITTDWPTEAGEVRVHDYLFFSVISRLVTFDTQRGGQELKLVNFCNCR